MKKLLFVALAPVVFLASGLLLAAPSPATPPVQSIQPAQTIPLSATLPSDPDTAVGTFPNGLRYYVRTNHEPQNRAELRLVVNAGSLLEEDDQQGLAHFVEHMAFNGTKHFPKQDIVSFMESIGMRFGPSVNAFTSFDETVYMLQIPTDKPEVLDKALLILEDWAHNVSFDPVEIDKERGVIIEEWRLRRGAAARMQDAQFPILLKGSRYAERIPIGKTEILNTFKPARLTQFYKDWYRPDLMAVIAVGDFDKAKVEALVRTHFASIPNPSPEKPRPTFDVPKQPGTLYAVATDKETAQATVSVYSKMPLRNQTTAGAYRQQIVERLFAGMLSSRLMEIAQKPNAPFMAAGAGRGLFVRSAEASTLSALVKEDGIGQGLEALFTEAERVAKFGFTATELERQKTSTVRGYERAIAELDKRQSGSLAAEYVRNFTQQEPFPGLPYEYDLVKRFVPAITLAEVNSLAREWVPDGNRVVVVSAPDKPGVVVPTDAQLAAAMKDAEAAAVTAYEDKVSTAPLVDPMPEPGRVTATAERSLGITEWTLSNGVKIVLKPTTFKEDEVVFRAFSPGGTSLASDADFIPAQTATQVLGASGLGSFSNNDLRKMLTGKVATVRPQIGELEEGVSGGGSPKDLETLFQLVYLNFTAPRADPVIFGVMTSQMKSLLTNQTSTPDFAFGEALTLALGQNHPRVQPTTPQMIDKMDLTKSLAFYQDRFADASDFTFVFVGSFTPDAIKPLVERYLGSLPATHRTEKWRDVGVRPPEGVVVKRVEKGIEPKSRAAIVFTGPFEYNQAERVAITAMSDVLENRLREVLREELGGTYSVSVSAGYGKIPVPKYSLGINFGSDPARTDGLITRMFAEIEKLKKDGPTATEVADVRTALERDFETNSKQNGFLLSQIVAKYELGEEPGSLMDVPGFYARLTPAIIQAAAAKYLDTKNYVQVTLFPEKKQ
jgi:zinc protease